MNGRLNAVVIVMKQTWGVIRPALNFGIVLAFASSILNILAFLLTIDWDKLLIAMLLTYMWMRELDDNLEELDEQ